MQEWPGAQHPLKVTVTPTGHDYHRLEGELETGVWVCMHTCVYIREYMCVCVCMCINTHSNFMGANNLDNICVSTEN